MTLDKALVRGNGTRPSDTFSVSGLSLNPHFKYGRLFLSDSRLTAQSRTRNRRTSSTRAHECTIRRQKSYRSSRCVLVRGFVSGALMRSLATRCKIVHSSGSNHGRGFALIVPTGGNGAGRTDRCPSRTAYFRIWRMVTRSLCRVEAESVRPFLAAASRLHLRNSFRSFGVMSVTSRSLKNSLQTFHFVWWKSFFWGVWIRQDEVFRGRVHRVQGLGPLLDLKQSPEPGNRDSFGSIEIGGLGVREVDLPLDAGTSFQVRGTLALINVETLLKFE